MRVKTHLHLPRLKAGVKECISVKPNGPTFYVDKLFLKDARFLVQPAGRHRAITTGQRNVHAYVSGEVVDSQDTNVADMPQAYYNPFKVETFVNKKTGEPVLKADYAIMINDRVWFSA